MEAEALYNLLQLPREAALPADEQLPQGAKRKYLPPNSRKDPKFEELQKVLMAWINATLLPEHVVVRSLEEDLFDGLILHHLFQKLAALRVEAEEIALTAASQRRKLEVVLGAVNQALQVEEPQAKWSVEAIFNKDLLATLHLLVALATHFQPNLPLPGDVQVEVITIESTKSGLKSGKSVERLTAGSTDKDRPSKDAFDELFKLAPEKVRTVEEAIVRFVNQKLERLGLSVQNVDTQFADGVVLLLLIGQLEGFFLHLREFYLTPSSHAEMSTQLCLLPSTSPPTHRVAADHPHTHALSSFPRACSATGPSCIQRGPGPPGPPSPHPWCSEDRGAPRPPEAWGSWCLQRQGPEEQLAGVRGAACSLQEVHNVTLALQLLKDGDLLSHPVSPEDIVNKDPRSTRQVLYSLFRKHKPKASTDGTPRGAPH